MENIIEELRIGNYISFINRNGEYHIPSTHPLKIYSISVFKVEVCQINENFAEVEKMTILDVNDLVGIPITEKWLIKLGFKFLGLMNFYGIDLFDDICLIAIPDGKAIAISQLKCKDINIDCKFVHQLQNLYFVLTGKTLMI